MRGFHYIEGYHFRNYVWEVSSFCVIVTTVYEISFLEEYFQLLCSSWCYKYFKLILSKTNEEISVVLKKKIADFLSLDGQIYNSV